MVYDENPSMKGPAMKKNIVIATATVLTVALYYGISARLFENELCRRFSSLTRNEVREVYGQFITNANNGMYGPRKSITVEKTYAIMTELVRERHFSR
jgi:hypothetical protein